MGNGKKERIRLDRLDMEDAVASREEYERKLKKRQTAMLHIQQAYWRERRRAIVVFEGWDAAGKGGCIRHLTEGLDPRGCRVWPIAAPEPAEQGRHYLYRFWQRLPEPGHIAVFDRSWYGRVLVERVEGLAPPKAWRRAYDEINEFERMLTDDGVRIIKLFLHVTPEVQLERFAERLRNPYKRWKLTEEDLRNRGRAAEYTVAVHDMFDHTATSNAPWFAIPANHKWATRLKVLKRVTDHLSDGIDLSPPPIDQETLRRYAERLGLPPEDLISPVPVEK